VVMQPAAPIQHQAQQLTRFQSQTAAGGHSSNPSLGKSRQQALTEPEASFTHDLTCSYHCQTTTNLAIAFHSEPPFTPPHWPQRYYQRLLDLILSWP